MNSNTDEMYKRNNIDDIVNKINWKNMDEITFQIYERIVSTMFNNGIIHWGRILTLFIFTRKLCHENPQYSERLWAVYYRTVSDENGLL